MSHEFRQVRYDRIIEDGEIHYEFTVKEGSIYKEDTGVLLIVPNIGSGTNYSKVLTECTMNMAFQAGLHLSKNIDLDKISSTEFADTITNSTRERYVPKRITQHGIDIEMTHQVREIAALLQWISNSSSWEHGDYFDFDKLAIKDKLDILKGYSR